MRTPATGWAFSGLVVGLLALTGASTASAQTYIRAQTAAYNQNTGFNVSDTGQIAGPVANAQSGPFADFGGTFQSKAFAQWNAGSSPTLGAFSAVTNTFPLYQAFTPAQAWWSLTFTAGGAPGSQVSYNVGIQLHDLLSSAVYPGFPSNLGAQASADYVGFGGLHGLAIHDLSTAPAALKTVWQVLTLNAGQSVTLGATLSTGATAQGGFATADAFSTGFFALNVLTPGGSYRTDNGTVFMTSFGGPSQGIPEPAAWALMIGGFGMTGGLLRRRRAITA